MSIATSSASSMDPLCTTGLLRLIPSLSPVYSTAPGLAETQVFFLAQYNIKIAKNITNIVKK
jgi:phage tail protein X